MIQLELPSQIQQRVTLSAIVGISIALLSVAFAPIFIRFSETELGANATIFNRLFIFAIVFGLSKVIRQGVTRFSQAQASTQLAQKDFQDLSQNLPFTVGQWALLIGVGLISIISLVLWAISLEYTSVAKSMLLNNLTPIFTSLGGWFLLGKRFDNRFLIGMLVALSGAIGLGLEDFHGGAEDNLLGDCYALLSAVFLGSYFLIVEQLRCRFCATTILLWRCIIGSALLLPIVLISEGQLFPTTGSAILAALGLGLICEGLGQRLLADSMDKFSSGFISLFLLLEPIVSAILAWAIFAEQFSTMTWFGFAIVLTGIYLAQTSQAALHKS